jgi:hypothetical protein
VISNGDQVREAREVGVGDFHGDQLGPPVAQSRQGLPAGASHIRIGVVEPRVVDADPETPEVRSAVGIDANRRLGSAHRVEFVATRDDRVERGDVVDGRADRSDVSKAPAK